MKQISDKGLNLIKKYESCRLRAYKAVSTEKFYTIGYGHYGSDVKKGQTITQERAEQLLREDVKRFEEKVAKYDNLYQFNQNQFDALVSFCYNIGSIDQLTDNGKRSITVLPEKMKLYVKSGGKTLTGLVTRRDEEVELFNTPVQSTVNVKKVSDVSMPTIKRGCNGHDVAVKIWQTIIGSEPDGAFGKNTEAKTVAFQKSKGLTPDGIVGNNTWRAGLESVK